MKRYQFECQFCRKRFALEGKYLKHKCKLMIRDQALREPEGQAAWMFYKDWLRFQRKRAPDDAMTFLTSMYYNAFNRFSIHVRALRLPKVEMFIKLMIELNYPPTLWTRDEVYSIYVQRLDAIATPKELVNISLKTLFDLSVEYDCDISKVFDHITGGYVAQLLRERKVTPWLLLRSKKFKQFLIKLHKSFPEQYIILETLINPSVWGSRFTQHPKTVKWIDNEVIPELGL